MEDGGFKEFPAHFPMHFYVGEIPEQQQDILVKFELDEEKANHFSMLDAGEFVISHIEDLALLNALIDDKIKIVEVFKKREELNEGIMDALENEKTFFEHRLRIYLDTNNRQVILYDYFNRPVDIEQNSSGFTEKEQEERFKQQVEEQKAHVTYWEEKTSRINTVDEAVDFLLHEEFDEETINEIKNKSLASKFDEFGGLFGMGMYLRNTFIYPNKNKEFLHYLRTYESQYMVNGGEFGEGIIDDLLWRELNHFRITDESKKKIADIRKEPYDEETSWTNYIKDQLVSYNLDEETIAAYLDLEDRKDASDRDFEFYYYDQKSILVKLSEDEISVYKQMKDDYFTIRDLIERLKQKS